jgi:hypothetical protein
MGTMKVTDDDETRIVQIAKITVCTGVRRLFDFFVYFGPQQSITVLWQGMTSDSFQ